MRILLAALALATLASCASLRTEKVVFVPPRIDCAVTDGPRAPLPSLPTVESIPAWQLYGFGWQAVAEDLMNQRVDTANCIEQLRQQGIVK